MTCIVAVVDGNDIYMGGDSAGVGPGFALQQRADQKVFINQGFIMGFTSSFRMGQILRYRFQPPRRHSGDDLLEYMSTSFVDEARETLKKYGWAQNEDGQDRGGTFLVGVEGQIFKIHCDFQVGQSLYPFDACGCGEDIALGVLFGLYDYKLEPDELLEQALEASSKFSAGVHPPFNILKLSS